MSVVRNKGGIKMTKDIKITAKEVKQKLTREYPKCSWSVRIERFSGGQALKVVLLSAPFKAFTKDIDCNGNKVNGYAQLNQYQFQRPNDKNVNNGAYLTREAWECMANAYKIASKDNWNNSKPEEDYFDVNYWLHMEIGQWNKPFELVRQS